MDRRRLLLSKKSGGLPSEYQEVEYIAKTQSSGDKPYLSVQIAPSYYSINAEVYITAKGGGWFSTIFGSDSLSVSSSHFISTNSDYFKYNQYATTLSDTQFSLLNRKTKVSYIYDDGISILKCSDGVEEKEASIEGHKMDNNIGIFLCRGDWDYGSTKFRLFNFNVIDIYGETIFNLIPCYRKSDGVIGMYDLCGSICPLTNTPFYINAGTGTFEKGPDKN